jgi:uncharacterized protein
LRVLFQTQQATKPNQYFCPSIKSIPLKGYLADKSPAFQFSILVLLWFFCFSLVNLLMAGVLVVYYGPENYKELAENLATGNINNNLLKIMQIVMSLGAFLLPPFILSYLKNEKLLVSTGLSAPPKIFLAALVIPVMLFASPFIMSVLELNQKMSLPSGLSWLEQYLKDSELQNENVLKRLLHMRTHFDFALNFLMVAVTPALCEEIFFRGCLQPILTTLYRNAHLGVIMSAMIFSFIHFQFYGFLPRMILGIMFGYLFLWTNNLWYPIIAHLLNNGAQVIFLYLHQKKIIQFDIETAESPAQLYVLISTILLFLALSVFHKKSGSIV